MRAEETGALPEELGVKLVLKGLNEELVEHYQALSEKYLTEAKEFLSEGDFVQTSEEISAEDIEKLIVKLKGVS